MQQSMLTMADGDDFDFNALETSTDMISGMGALSNLATEGVPLSSAILLDQMDETQLSFFGDDPHAVHTHQHQHHHHTRRKQRRPRKLTSPNV
eukprot:m.125831 g.125831  ORF g.125831 m.125831 type:complete len:93 (-) comp29157_c0_seq1:634-912(-)